MVIWVKVLMSKIYSKSLVRAIDKVLLMKLRDFLQWAETSVLGGCFGCKCTTPNTGTGTIIAFTLNSFHLFTFSQFSFWSLQMGAGDVLKIARSKGHRMRGPRPK